MQKRSDWARNINTGAPSPVASISVKIRGTDTLAPIFSDDGVTPKANPFAPAPSTGIYGWYAANGRYDETVTPAAASDGTTYTNTDILLYDPED